MGAFTGHNVYQVQHKPRQYTYGCSRMRIKYCQVCYTFYRVPTKVERPHKCTQSARIFRIMSVVIAYYRMCALKNRGKSETKISIRLIILQPVKALSVTVSGPRLITLKCTILKTFFEINRHGRLRRDIMNPRSLNGLKHNYRHRGSVMSTYQYNDYMQHTTYAQS